jgi:hypothetical protein
VTNAPLTPTEGARFLLEREQDDGTRARYRAAIYTPDATYEGHATLTDDGSVEIEAAGAPDELFSTLQMLAKLTARSAAKKREDGLPPWPARVLRWRGPGRGQ